MVRRLPEGLVALVARIADELPGDDRVALLEQARMARVVREVPGRAIDLDVPVDVPSVVTPEGLLRPVPAVRDHRGELVGELILWVRAGRLIGMERPWFTEAPPDEWPDVADLDFG